MIWIIVIANQVANRFVLPTLLMSLIILLTPFSAFGQTAETNTVAPAGAPKATTEEKPSTVEKPPTDAELNAEELPQNDRPKGFFKWVHFHPSFFKLKYYFAAQNAKDCEFFYGLIQDNPLIGRASIDFNSENGCKCHGVAQVTHYPRGGGAGQRGYIKVKCSEGLTMKGNFTTTSLTTGYATLEDSRGHKFEGTFGHTAEQAIERINTLRRQLGCPEVTAKEIELKVQGVVITK